ncbi:MAG: methyltransferase [Methylococcales bacterium]
METLLNVPQGTFEIQRVPYRKNETLRAWDAADEYLLQYLSELESLAKESRVLILNDKFGALVTALNQYKLVAISDSWLSQHATRLNIEANRVTERYIQLNSTMNWPNQVFDLVLIKIPKTLALLEDQLIHLQAVITENTIIVAAGMVKAMSANVWKMLEKYIGPTKPSQAKKKARLIFVDIAADQQKLNNPYPVYYTLEKTAYRICNHANVFSRASLDIGTRFLLEHLPKNTTANDIIDLGCGNGVVGLMLAESHPATLIHFVDESYMAVASAKENFNHAYPNRKAKFYITDGLTEFEAEMADLIICNPPFHQQNTVGDQIALSMFKQSYRVLRPGGSLWVIGNRHLGYPINLKRLFSNYKEIAANKKFVIWQVNKL